MIELKKVSYRYPGAADFAVHDIDLTIESGSLVGVTGAAGSGKSTLTYVLNGIVPHCYQGDFYGEAYVEGLDTVETPLTEISRVVGSVCQDIDSQMVSSMVEDEMLFGLENFGVDRAQIPSRIDEALDMLGISDLKDRTIDSLSGGQKQKLALASILALKPRVLVLDEPTAELDPMSSASVFKLLKDYVGKTGATAIVVEQKIALTASYADMLVVMDKGHIRFSGTPQDVLAHSEELYQLGVNCPRVTTLMNRLKKRGAYTGAPVRTVKEAQKACEEMLYDRVS